MPSSEFRVPSKDQMNSRPWVVLPSFFSEEVGEKVFVEMLLSYGKRIKSLSQSVFSPHFDLDVVLNIQHQQLQTFQVSP